MALEHEGHGQWEHPDAPVAILQMDGISGTADDSSTEPRTRLLDDKVEGGRHLGVCRALRSRVDQGPGVGRTGVLAHETTVGEVEGKPRNGAAAP